MDWMRSCLAGCLISPGKIKKFFQRKKTAKQKRLAVSSAVSKELLTYAKEVADETNFCECEKLCKVLENKSKA